MQPVLSRRVLDHGRYAHHVEVNSSTLVGLVARRRPRYKISRMWRERARVAYRGQEFDGICPTTLSVARSARPRHDINDDTRQAFCGRARTQVITSGPHLYNRHTPADRSPQRG